MWFRGSGCRVCGFLFVSFEIRGYWFRLSRFKVSRFGFSRFRVSGSWVSRFQVSDSSFPCFGFGGSWFPSSGFPVRGFDVRGYGLGVSRFGVQGFGYVVSRFVGFQVRGFTVRGLEAYFHTNDLDHIVPSAAIALLQEFGDVFPDDIPSGLPPLRGIEHQIDFVPGASTPNRPAYRSIPRR